MTKEQLAIKLEEVLATKPTNLEIAIAHYAFLLGQTTK